MKPLHFIALLLFCFALIAQLAGLPWGWYLVAGLLVLFLQEGKDEMKDSKTIED